VGGSSYLAIYNSKIIVSPSCNHPSGEFFVFQKMTREPIDLIKLEGYERYQYFSHEILDGSVTIDLQVGEPHVAKSLGGALNSAVMKSG
jgi:hypothetical protein